MKKKRNADNVDTLHHNDNTTVLSSAGDAQIFLICLRQTRVYGKRMLLYVHNEYDGGRRGHDFRVTRACFLSWHAQLYGRNYCFATTSGIKSKKKITADKPACKPFALYRDVYTDRYGGGIR